MAEVIPLPRPRPSETDIFQAEADARHNAAMAKIAAMLNGSRTSPPSGQPLFSNPNNPDDPILGPLNITPQPIYYPNAIGFMGPPVKK